MLGVTEVYSSVADNHWPTSYLNVHGCRQRLRISVIKL